MQVEEKQEHLAETALLVEKMFSEFSTLQGFQLYFGSICLLLLFTRVFFGISCYLRRGRA
jgi:hypothetical protein